MESCPEFFWTIPTSLFWYRIRVLWASDVSPKVFESKSRTFFIGWRFWLISWCLNAASCFQDSQIWSLGKVETVCFLPFAVHLVPDALGVLQTKTLFLRLWCRKCRQFFWNESSLTVKAIHTNFQLAIFSYEFPVEGTKVNIWETNKVLIIKRFWLITELLYKLLATVRSLKISCVILF